MSVPCSSVPRRRHCSGNAVTPILASDPENKSVPGQPLPVGRWLSMSHLLTIGLAASCLWAYAPALAEMADRWAHEPQYSHGYLVPVFALFLLWHRRSQYPPRPFQGTPWGLGLVLASVGLYLAGI